jgi:hypothetical protein
MEIDISKGWGGKMKNREEWRQIVHEAKAQHRGEGRNVFLKYYAVMRGEISSQAMYSDLYCIHCVPPVLLRLTKGLNLGYSQNCQG